MDRDPAGLSRAELEDQVRSLRGIRTRVAQNAQLLQELVSQRNALEDENAALREARRAHELSHAEYVDRCDFAPLAYYTFDLFGCIRYVNLTGATMIGMERDRLLGQPFASLIGPANTATFFRHLATCRDERRAAVSELCIQRRGETLHVRCFSVPVLGLSGAPTAFRTAFADIRDLTAARHEVRVVREAARRSSLTAERFERAAIRLHQLLHNGSSLDVLGAAIADEARLLVDADHVLLSLAAPEWSTASALFESGSRPSTTAEHRLIRESVRYVDTTLAEFWITKTDHSGSQAHDQAHLRLFATHLGPLLELARLRSLAPAHARRMRLVEGG